MGNNTKMDVIKTQNHLLIYLHRDLSNLIIEYIYESNQELESERNFYKDSFLNSLAAGLDEDAEGEIRLVMSNLDFPEQEKYKFGKILIDRGHGKNFSDSLHEWQTSESLKKKLYSYYLETLDQEDWINQAEIFLDWLNLYDLEITSDSILEEMKESYGDKNKYEIECYLPHMDKLIPALLKVKEKYRRGG